MCVVARLLRPRNQMAHKLCHVVDLDPVGFKVVAEFIESVVHQPFYLKKLGGRECVPVWGGCDGRCRCDSRCVCVAVANVVVAESFAEMRSDCGPFLNIVSVDFCEILQPV